MNENWRMRRSSKKIIVDGDNKPSEKNDNN